MKLVMVKKSLTEGILFLIFLAIPSAIIAQNPSINNIEDVIINQNSTTQLINLSGISDGNGNTQTITITAASNDETLIPTPSVIYTSPQPTGSLTFTPATDEYGTCILTVTVTDPDGSIDETFTVTVNAIPLTNTDSNEDSFSTNEDTQLNISAANGVLNNDEDPFYGSLEAVLDTDVSHGTLSFNSDGSFTYSPDENYHGSDSFSYHLNDGTATSSSVSVSLSISSENDPPQLQSPTTTTLSYAENDGAVAILDDITVQDMDNTNLSNATITISANFNDGEDRLNFTSSGSITGSYNSSTGVLSISGNASLANYQA
ncbi:hypothetical protein DMA11_01450, partial [Marinilabiliaceae bacterium JC017]